MHYLFIIILLLVLFYIWQKTKIQPESQLPYDTIITYHKQGDIVLKKTEIKQKVQPIITYHKTGGIAGNVIKLEIYGNHTYKLFDHDKVIKSGEVDFLTSEAVMEILKRYHVLKEIPKREIDGNDFIYSSIDVQGHGFDLDADNFGENRIAYEKLVSENKKLFGSIEQLESLTNN